MSADERSLLKIAEGTPVLERREFQDADRVREELELAASYLDRRITGHQVAVALGIKPCSVGNWIGMALLRAWKLGLIGPCTNGEPERGR